MMGGGNKEKAEVIQTLLFVTALNTLLQSFLGTRLRQRFLRTMRGIQGALIIASLFQMVVGFLGFWRNVVWLLSPLSAVPLVTMVGIGLYRFGFPLAVAVKGLDRTLQTDYILKILGLDACSDTMIGDALRRGISGGQKKRLTTGEMIVGPTKALFMDEISNGLDSSTTFQVVSCLQQLVHITDTTALVSLLQPAPETYDLFDDIILMAEGKIVYQGPRSHVLEFFEDCGFKCPERKGAADFLQEVISRKDQRQYWYQTERPYNYISIDQFSKKFKACHIGKKLDEELVEPYDKSLSHKDALSFSKYSLTNGSSLKPAQRENISILNP